MPPTVANTAKGPIEYRLEGRGPTVVVLNGGHCSRETRLSHEQLAAAGYSVLTPSRPGYDETPLDVGRTAQDAADAIAALLDALRISAATVIGISAAGPTALAFAQRHPTRTQGLILESAVATDWNERTKWRARLGFGRAAKVTWAVMHLTWKLFPNLMLKAVLHDLTSLDVTAVLKRMTPADWRFIDRMILTCGPSTGFVNDVEHTVDHLATITAPVLVMFSPYDNTVSPNNARRLSAEIVKCELFEVPSDTHLIWIGPSSNDVWQKRLSFLRSTTTAAQHRTGATGARGEA